MAKVSKAKRGKRRWVGFSVPDSIQSREQLVNFIKDAAIFGDKWKLADFTDGLAIMRLPLEVYLQQKETMQKGISGMKSLAASGKIRLVRERLGITKEPRKK